MEIGNWKLEFGFWNLEFGIWNLEFGIWIFEFGVVDNCFFTTFAVWSDGRVARLSSAKAATAVRIRFRPRCKLLKRYKSNDCNALFFLLGYGIGEGTIEVALV